MDRKKTILIAVMINAGLLAVLFVSALSSQDEIGPVEIAQKPLSTMNEPLFPGGADSVLQQSIAPAPTIHVPVSLKAPVNEVPKGIELVHAPEITHRLPVQASEPIPAPLVAAFAPRLDTTGIEVTVKKGDSLDKIAKAHHTTVDEIIKINQLPGSFLKVGQILKLPDPKTLAQAVKPKPIAEKQIVMGPEYYTVKVGDNPWGIAMKHHMKVEELLKLNNLNEERARKLKPGDRLRIR
jgi:peptidoglycan endopeptidase LytF